MTFLNQNRRPATTRIKRFIAMLALGGCASVAYTAPGLATDDDPRVLFSPTLQISQVRAPERRVAPLIDTPGMQAPAMPADSSSLMDIKAPAASTSQSQRVSLDELMANPTLTPDGMQAPSMLANPQPVIGMVGREFVPVFDRPRVAAPPAPVTQTPKAQVVQQMPAAPTAPAAPQEAPPMMQTNLETAAVAQVQTVTPPVVPLAAREFIPRFANSDTTGRGSGMVFTPFQSSEPLPPPGMMPVDQGLQNVMIRFKTLMALREAQLITPAEYDMRRNANIGALLPYSKSPPASGLTRPSPESADVLERLHALRRSLEMRAISARQHELERTMILNALMPAKVTRAALAPTAPTDVLAAAAYVGRLQGFTEQGLVNSAEFAEEKKAVEQRVASAEARASAAQAAKQASVSKSAMTSPPATDKMGRPMPAPPKPKQMMAKGGAGNGAGMSVHLASYRSMDAALTGWAEISTRHRALVDGLQPDVKPVQIKGKGTYYRIYAGPVANKAAANRLCSRLKAAGQYCDPAPS